jgi:hypothetical protein
VNDVTEHQGIVVVRTLVLKLSRQTRPSLVTIMRLAITPRACTDPKYAIPAPTQNANAERPTGGPAEPTDAGSTKMMMLATMKNAPPSTHIALTTLSPARLPTEYLYSTGTSSHIPDNAVCARRWPPAESPTWPRERSKSEIPGWCAIADCWLRGLAVALAL